MYKKFLYLLTFGFFVGVCQPVLAGEGLEFELPSAPVSGGTHGGGTDGAE